MDLRRIIGTLVRRATPWAWHGPLDGPGGRTPHRLAASAPPDDGPEAGGAEAAGGASGGTDEPVRRAAQLRVDAARRFEVEHRYRALVERLPAVFYISALDPSNTTLYVSPQVERLLGFPLESWRESPFLWIDRLHAEDRARVMSALSRCHVSWEPFACEYRLLARNGREVWVRDSATVVKEPGGEVPRLLGIMLDITDRKREEEALRAGEALKAAILEASADPVLVLDSRGRVLELNPAAERTFGLTRADALGQEMIDLIIPPEGRERHRKELQRILESGDGPLRRGGPERIAVRADGREFAAELTLSRARSESPPLFSVLLRRAQGPRGTA